MSNRVLAAMSGGVDSSVAASLLLKQGMHVEGVTLKLTAGQCCNITSAQAVCHQLRIPHRMIDAESEFSRLVIQNFISEYRRGRTPNPCIKCNDLIKFQLLLDYALSEGFDYLATGHYARVEQDAASQRFQLKKGVDAAKDQSYFLYRLSPSRMKHILMPLGNLRKAEVRGIARDLSLPAAERPESQEICFVPDNNYRNFLKEHAPETLLPGELAMVDGKIVGRHEGVAFFTVGQRRKLGVAAGERLYVVKVEPEINRVILGRHADLAVRELVVSDPNLITVDSLAEQMRVNVKIRYRSPYAAGVAEHSAPGKIRVRLELPVSGVCPGQAAVFYDGDKVIGGGTIENYSGTSKS